jgi:hypothetical protein
MLFLEKISDMFEAIANVLPPYRQIYTICQQRIDTSQVVSEDAQLTMLMSFAYADIVRMCLDLYRIFFRDNTGTHRISYMPLQFLFIIFLYDFGSFSRST